MMKDLLSRPLPPGVYKCTLQSQSGIRQVWLVAEGSQRGETLVTYGAPVEAEIQVTFETGRTASKGPNFRSVKNPQFHCEVDTPKPPVAFITIDERSSGTPTRLLNGAIRAFLPKACVIIKEVRWPE